MLNVNHTVVLNHQNQIYVKLYNSLALNYSNVWISIAIDYEKKYTNEN